MGSLNKNSKNYHHKKRKKRNYVAPEETRKRKEHKKPWYRPTKVTVKYLVVVLLVALATLIYIKFQYNDSELNLANNRQVSSVVDEKSAEVDFDFQSKTGEIFLYPKQYEKPKGGIFLIVDKDTSQESYLSLGAELSSKGYIVIIMKYDTKKENNKKIINSYINRYNDLTRWIIGGHNQSSNLAATMVGVSSRIKGIFYLGGEVTIDLSSKKDFKGLALVGDKDKNYTLTKSKEYLPLLPERSLDGNIINGSFDSYGDLTSAGSSSEKSGMNLQISAQIINLMDFLP